LLKRIAFLASTLLDLRYVLLQCSVPFFFKPFGFSLLSEPLPFAHVTLLAQCQLASVLGAHS
jgi:hypothetical protein